MQNLNGKTILLTRAAEDNESWASIIKNRGGRAVSLPCIVCEPIRNRETAAILREAMKLANWLVLTSRRGVAAVAELDIGPLPESVRIAVVGTATAVQAQAQLGRCDLTGSSGTGYGLAMDLAATLARDGSPRGVRVVVASAERAAHYFEEVLGPLGVSVERVAVYRTLPATPAKEKHDLSTWGLDVILLASPSAARGLINLANLPDTVDVVSIGPVTTREARSLGIKVTAQAERPELEAILEALS